MLFAHIRRPVDWAMISEGFNLRIGNTRRRSGEFLKWRASQIIPRELRVAVDAPRSFMVGDPSAISAHAHVITEATPYRSVSSYVYLRRFFSHTFVNSQSR